MNLPDRCEDMVLRLVAIAHTPNRSRQEVRSTLRYDTIGKAHRTPTHPQLIESLATVSLLCTAATLWWFDRDAMAQDDPTNNSLNLSETEVSDVSVLESC
jgi:hypothetical protein